MTTLKLEKMGEFFDNRLLIYDEHQLNAIDFAKEFYPKTASLLPKKQHAKVLDLGCGTGLELESYLKNNPSAKITGIDLAPKMLEALKNKFKDKTIYLINGSYFDVDIGENCFDAALSVESFHHFTKAQKEFLYKKIRLSLKNDGYFILTDYFSKTDEQEKFNFRELKRLKEEQHISDNTFYHYDTPLTLSHEIEAMKTANFSKIEIIKSWGATSLIKAYK